MVGLGVAIARTVSKIWAIMLIYVALLCFEAQLTASRREKFKVPLRG